MLKKKCTVQANEEAKAKQRFENGEVGYHKYVLSIEEKFDSAIFVDDRKES